MIYYIIYSKKLFTGGIALFPFIVIKDVDKKNQVLINHEKIHNYQQLECLILPFYLVYLLNYLVNLVIYRNHNKAYRNIIFEKEAFENEANSGYLNTRPVFGFLSFRKKR